MVFIWNLLCAGSKCCNLLIMGVILKTDPEHPEYKKRVLSSIDNKPSEKPVEKIEELEKKTVENKKTK